MTNLECNNTITQEQLVNAATEQAAFFRAMNNTEQANTLQELAQCIRDLQEEIYELKTSYDVLGGVDELRRMRIEELEKEVEELSRQLAEAQAEKNRLVRDLDVLWNGEEGAAKQASLCDMVAQISKELPSLREAQARLAELEGQEPVLWAEFAENGNIRIWTSASEPVRKIAENVGMNITPLYARPAHSPTDQKDAARWIPVTERLPEMDTPVWLYETGRGAWVGERGDTGEGWMFGNTYGSHYLRQDGTWNATENDQDDDYQPTHWMPLPAAPDAAMLAASPTVPPAAADERRPVMQRHEPTPPNSTADRIRDLEARLDLCSHERANLGETCASLDLQLISAHRAANVLMEALENIAASAEQHPAYIPDADSEEIEREGGDAAFVTADIAHAARFALATVKQIMGGA